VTDAVTVLVDEPSAVIVEGVGDPTVTLVAGPTVVPWFSVSVCAGLVMVGLGVLSVAVIETDPAVVPLVIVAV
jgi:hypothetical protein